MATAGSLVVIGVLSTQNAPNYADFYEADGPYETDWYYRFNGNSLVLPEDLGEDGVDHPIIVWGDGTLSLPIIYRGLLKHLASHGFVVIAPNTMFTGDGEKLFEAIDLMFSENSELSSILYQKLDTSKICVMGHSQGGGTTLIVGEDERITCTVPIQPWAEIYSDASQQNGPMFLITSTEDVFCPPEENSDLIFANSNVPTVYGNVIGETHLTPLNNAGSMQKYITAWCYAHLYDDDDAQATFYGENPTMLEDDGWIWQVKNM